MKKMRIAAFGGFRSIPPTSGSGGCDKFAYELYPRIVNKGHLLIAYCRVYPSNKEILYPNYNGIQIKYFKTINKAGFDILLHSAKATFDIIFNNTADFVHIQSGANSIWAIFLKLAGKKVIVTQFSMDWKRDKWPWYGKLFHIISIYFTAYFPDMVVFDNVYAKEYFERKFSKKFNFIPYGSEVDAPPSNINILDKLNLKPSQYFLFIGRFIPDKGIHILIDAFKKLNTAKKLVLIGGAPNPSKYELDLTKSTDTRIFFPGYIYGDDANILIQNSYAYVQPSLIEGLSPVILTVMSLGAPLICSDIRENTFITKENAVTFKSGDSESLHESLAFSLKNENVLYNNAVRGRSDIRNRFNWQVITNSYLDLFYDLERS